ncbi:hypothetical protein ACHAWF_014353 [Thalassiosira exigua]
MSRGVQGRRGRSRAVLQILVKGGGTTEFLVEHKNSDVVFVELLDPSLLTEEGEGDPVAAKGTDDDPREKKGMIDGKESLLIAIEACWKSDPQVKVECKFLGNAFDALAAALLRENNTENFVRAEGIELT